MNIAKLQDIKLTHRNPLHSYTLTMRKQKEKLGKQYHSPVQQKEIQKTLNSQSNLEKEEWNWRNQPA